MTTARLMAFSLLLVLPAGGAGEKRESAPSADSSRFAHDAEMVDSLHIAGMPAGTSYLTGLARRRSFQIQGDSGPVDLYLPIPHFHPFRLVLVCPHGAPRVGDAAWVECVENDARIVCLGVDGSGSRVRKSPSLASTARILSVRKGHVTLSCPGDGSRRLKVHTEGEWVQGYLAL